MYSQDNKPGGYDYRPGARNSQAPQAERNELFQGRQEQKPMNYDEMDNDQLVQHAENTHKQTTDAARRALKTLDQTLGTAQETNVKLAEQTGQMQKMNKQLNDVNQNLTYSEKLLRYMRMCCCCWMFDCCTGADPEVRKRKDWESKVDKGKTAKQDDYQLKENLPGQQAKRPLGADGLPYQNGAGYRDPTIDLGEGNRDAQLRMQAETRAQNQVFDQIGNRLTLLKGVALQTNEELNKQNAMADQLGSRMETTDARIKQINTQSQLRKYK